MSENISSLHEVLSSIRQSVKNARGAIESNQVVDKDVHGTLTRVIAAIDAALTSPAPTHIVMGGKFGIASTGTEPNTCGQSQTEVGNASSFDQTTAPAELLVVGKFSLGDRVRKTKGSSWQGRVVGFYSTELTPSGYAVESERDPGSVQIYPESALAALASTEGTEG
jgi:hypothetical protein